MVNYSNMYDSFKPPVKHHKKQLTLHTGKIIAFGPKEVLVAKCERLKKAEIECKLGHSGGSRFWHLYVKRGDAERAERIVGGGVSV